MFAKACALVRQFMQPVIISMRFYDQSVGCNGANFVILNDEGRFLLPSSGAVDFRTESGAG